MSTPTPIFGLPLPLVNNAVDQDLWGNELNSGISSIDTLLSAGINYIPVTQTANFSIAAPTAQSTTIGGAKGLYLVNASSGVVTGTLPSASSAGAGFTAAIKKTDNSTNVVTVAVTGSDTIDGANSVALATQFFWVVLVSNGTNAWSIIGQNSPTTTNIVRKVTTQSFSAVGTNTYTPNQYLVCADIILVGGGGGGGSSFGTNNGCGGGGSGGMCRRILTAAQIGTSQTITIGGGGAGGSNAGVNSSFGAFMTAAGGGGGGSSGVPSSPGGSGGGASGGDFNYTGGAGGAGFGANGYAMGGAGGSILGGNAPGSASFTGNNATMAGGGGAGGSGSNAGGAGATGACYIVEYCYQ